jgi:hypothetical protein
MAPCLARATIAAWLLQRVHLLQSYNRALRAEMASGSFALAMPNWRSQ